MASLRPSGQVQSLEQIRADRFRRGQCETCFDDPVQCFAIKKRIGGLLRDRVPLTEEGKVYNGICLACHPDKDPRSMIRRARTDSGRHRRPHHRDRHHRDRHHWDQESGRPNARRGPRMPTQMAFNMNGDRGDDFERTTSTPNVRLERGIPRQEGYIDISRSMPEEEEDRLSQSMPARFQNQNSAAHLDFADELEQEQDEPGYVEEITYNIFNEPVIVRKPKWRSKKVATSKSINRHDVNLDSPTSPLQSGTHSHRRPSHEHHDIMPPPFEEKVEEGATEDFEYAKPPPETIGGNEYYNGNGFHDEYGNDHGFHRQDTGPTLPFKHHSSRKGFMEETKKPSVPDLAPVSDADNQSKSSGDNESLDALAKIIAQHCAKNPEETVRFVPGTKTIVPNAELQLDEQDDISVLTKETFWQGRETFATLGTYQKSHMTGLSAISEVASAASSSAKQPSLASHRIVEPEAVPAHETENYSDVLAPNLQTLREIVGQCTQIGDDEGAIDILTESLVVDNATSESQDLAMFCLTELWVLARKSDSNKRKIIFEDATCDRPSVTFQVIIEAMRIYCDSSVAIQTRACGVLWSLSMASNDRKHVAQGGGCESILNAMLAHVDDDALQVMAMGALKVLSFDNIGKSMLRAFGALPIISGVMQKHLNNPSIQTEGCVILGNLAVDEANQKVIPVGEGEIEAVILGMLEHEDSLEVHEAACFTLMSLASSPANVELIQSNSMSKVALELAFQKHPDDVGIHILTLLRRLKFDSPARTEGKQPFEDGVNAY